MIYPILLLIGAAGCSVCFGAVMNKCARDKGNFNLVQGQNAGLICICSLLLAAQFSQLPHSWYDAGIILVIQGAAGVTAYYSFMLSSRAMKYGHSGLAWALVNAGVILPVFMGMIVFGDRLTWWNILCLVIVAIGFFLIGISKSNGGTSKGLLWLVPALGAFLLGGVSGCANLLASYFPELHATPMFRTAGNTLSGFFCYLLTVAMTKDLRRPGTKNEYRYIFLIFLTSCLSCYVFIYNAYDQLAKIQMAGIAPLVTVGFSVVGYMIYSTLILRERTNVFGWSGFSLTATGCLAFMWTT